MSVFNAEEYLAEAIESILNQTYSNLEFIIIDDGSTDSSLMIFQKYAEEDQRIRIIINEKNIGLAKSLNNGIDISRGMYIARMDADDISLPDRFHKQVSYLDDHPEVYVVGGQFAFIGAPSNYISNHAIEKELLRWHMLLNYSVIAHPTAMIRRQALVSAGNYPENYIYAQDRALWTRLYMLSEYPIANLPDTLIYYRKHEGNVSNHKKEYQRNVDLQCQQELLQFEFNTTFDRNIVEILIDPVPLKFGQSKIATNLILSLFKKYLTKHQVENRLSLKLKETTTFYIFQRMHKYPLRGCVEIIKSIFLYPPIIGQYVCYYALLPINIFKRLLSIASTRLTPKKIR
jgi:glycosyltransferase involved in cell wall biosynthesis